DEDGLLETLPSFGASIVNGGERAQRVKLFISLGEDLDQLLRRPAFDGRLFQNRRGGRRQLRGNRAPAGCCQTHRQEELSCIDRDGPSPRPQAQIFFSRCWIFSRIRLI